MEIPTQIIHLKEIDILITDKALTYYGGDQDWYPTKWHQLSGCGPVAAANITAHLALNFPKKFGALYPFSTQSISKKDFICHMVNIRKYVIPGLFGLTSVKQFSNNVLTFASSQGVTLTPHLVKEPSTADDALDFIVSALEQSIPVALLILTHPVREFSGFVWHWMTIHHYYINELTNKRTIVISSCGERLLIDFDLLWNKRRSLDIIRLIYFT